MKIKKKIVILFHKILYLCLLTKVIHQGGASIMCMHLMDIVKTTNCVIGTNKLSLFANKVGARTNAKLG